MEKIIGGIAKGFLSLVFLVPLWSSFLVWRGSRALGVGFWESFDNRADAVFSIGLAALGAFIAFEIFFG